MYNDLSNFNRRIQNVIVLLINRHGGEIHGSWFEIADLIQMELGGVVDDEDTHMMRRHLQAVGFDHLTANSAVVYFHNGRDPINLVDRSLVYEVAE